MAARRKKPGPKKRRRKKVAARGRPTPTSKKKRVPARPPRTKERALAKKKRARVRPIAPSRPKKRAVKKKRARVRPIAPPRPKKRAVKKKRRVVRLSPQQRAALTRAERALRSLGEPREYWRRSKKELYDRRREQLVRALDRAGFDAASIRAQLGWVTRRRTDARKQLAVKRIEVLGTERLDKKDRRGLWAEEDRNRILRNMIRSRDERWEKFLKTAQEEYGLEYSEVENEWFSPKVI